MTCFACDKRVHARGMCVRHYMQWFRNDFNFRQRYASQIKIMQIGFDISNRTVNVIWEKL